jgi:HAD superfamily hydrolase (TIGR01450 family)
VAGLAGRYGAVVCDLDGVVYRGPVAVDHAVAALAALPIPVVYATNNASRPPAQVARHLTELGLEVDAQDVVTSSQAGARQLRRLLPAGATVLAVGGDGVREALLQEGFAVLRPAEVGSGPSAPVAGVLQGYGAGVTAADLAEAAYAVSAGALWVATNTDETLPTHRGTSPGNGMLVAAVRRAVDRDPLVVGKPLAPLYELAAERLRLPVRSVLAVGDRLDTDIAGAAAAGMDSALVLTGVDSVTSLAVAPGPLRPTYLLEDLRALEADYPAVDSDAGWWHCGGARRRVVHGRWEVARDGTTIEAARAGLGCLHAGLDAGDLDEEAVRRLAPGIDAWQ